MSFGQLNVQSSGMVTDKGEKIIILVLFLVGDEAIFYLEKFDYWQREEYYLCEGEEGGDETESVYLDLFSMI